MQPDRSTSIALNTSSRFASASRSLLRSHTVGPHRRPRHTVGPHRRPRLGPHRRPRLTATSAPGLSDHICAGTHGPHRRPRLGPHRRPRLAATSAPGLSDHICAGTRLTLTSSIGTTEMRRPLPRELLTAAPVPAWAAGLAEWPWLSAAAAAATLRSALLWLRVCGRQQANKPNKQASKQTSKQASKQAGKHKTHNRFGRGAKRRVPRAPDFARF